MRCDPLDESGYMRIHRGIVLFCEINPIKKISVDGTIDTKITELKKLSIDYPEKFI